MSNFKTFLISEKMNSQGWRIPKEILIATKDQWLNVPGILYKPCSRCKYSHTAGADLEDAIQKSRDNAVTRIVDVSWENGALYAQHEIIDPAFVEPLCDDLYSVSPSVWNLTKEDNPVVSFVPVHLAFLNQAGAFGSDAEALQTDHICQACKINKQCTGKAGMDPEKKKEEEKPKEEPQKFSMEDTMKSMHAMMTDMHKKAMAEPEKKKEEEPKKDAAAPEQKKASAGLQSFDWYKAEPTNNEPERIDLSTVPL